MCDSPLSPQAAQTSETPMGMPMQDPTKMMGMMTKMLFAYIPNIALFMWVNHFFQ